MVKDITDADFQALVIEGSKTRPVIVDFWATWCAPCRHLSPIIEKVGAGHAAAVDTYKMDTDANQQTSAMMGIRSIPTVVAFKDGSPATGFVGAQPEQVVRDLYRSLLPSEDDVRVLETARLSDAEAEPALREILSRDPDHRGAILALARLLGRRGDGDEARALLARIPEDDETRKVAASIEMSAAASLDINALKAAADAGDGQARAKYAVALASLGRYERALDELIAAVRDGAATEARAAMLDIFAVLGNENPLVARYRRELANALF